MTTITREDWRKAEFHSAKSQHQWHVQMIMEQEGLTEAEAIVLAYIENANWYELRVRKQKERNGD